MRKPEVITFSALAVFYVNNIFGIEVAPGLWTLLNFLSFVILALFGFKIYKSPKGIGTTNHLLAILSGISFSLGIFAFGLKIWNYQNSSLIIFASPNLLLFFFLLYLRRKYTKSENREFFKYLNGLLIRSSLILTICIVVLFLSFEKINLYLNRAVPVLHSRGLAEKHLRVATRYIENNEPEKSMMSAKSALNYYKIGWQNDSTMYIKPYEALYNAYWKLILKYAKRGGPSFLSAQIQIREIKPLLRILYGDSSSQSAAVKTAEACIYQRQNKFYLSDSLYMSAMAIYKSVYKNNTFSYATTLQLLASSYRDRYNYKNAIGVFKAAVEVLQKDTSSYDQSQNNTNDPDLIEKEIANVNAEIGWTFSLRGNKDSAEVYFSKAFNIKSYEHHRGYSLALTNFAFHTINKGEFRKAKRIMERALKIALLIFGQQSYEYLKILDGLNSIDITLANYAAAEYGCNKSLDILKEIDPSNQDYLGHLTLQLADIKHLQGFYQIAQELYNDALRLTDPSQIRYYQITKALSSLQSDFASYSASYDLALKARKGAEQYYEEATNTNLSSYYRIEGYVTYLLGQNQTALSLYQKCLRLDTVEKGGDKLDLAATLNGIGLIKTELKKFEEADTMFSRTLEIYRKQLGNYHPEYATVIHNIGYLRIAQGNLAESNRLFNQALEIVSKTLGDKHDKIADNLTALGEIELRQKRLSEAKKYFVRAHEIYSKKFKPEHKMVVQTLKYIALCK